LKDPWHLVKISAKAASQVDVQIGAAEGSKVSVTLGKQPAFKADPRAIRQSPEGAARSCKPRREEWAEVTRP
jgi:hypothetical protein